MKFAKGHKKQGGRKSGSKNKIHVSIKTRVATLIDDQFDDVQTRLAELDAKEYVTAYIKLLEFVLPKQREQKIDLDTKMGMLSDEELNRLIDQILKNP